ncbi:putative Ras-related protein Rab-33 [Bacillus rossius redtenbacheri]|uniref:putative Ras-related protein Rab-33 n=1 Tax=Bacillus rossius redtenbacheri TaxID=93214 RepID=UPI002FDD4277
MVTDDRSKSKQTSTILGAGSSKRVFKIIVVGDSNVGKTCLTYRFCEGKFLQKSEATIGVDFRERTVDVNGEEIKLQLWDTAGQERFRKSMVQHYYRNVHAVVIVYDVTKMASFQSLPQWIEECNRNNLTSDIPRILVGNKCDSAATQVVNTHSAQQFADIHHMPLFETSALDESECDHVDAIFMTLAHKLKNRRPMMSPPTASNALHRAEIISVERETRTDPAEQCWC